MMASTLNLIHGDCMKYLPDYPDKYFELAIVDPPYGIGIGTMNYTTSGAIRTRGNCSAKRRDYRKKGDWDTNRPQIEYFTQLFRISKNQIIWGGNYFADLLPVSKSFIIWDKRNDLMINDFSDCEQAWCSTGVARMFRFLWNGMLQGNMKNKQDRIHPTEKPYQLYKWLLHNYANPGDKILDTHLGSMSIAIACYDYGFDLTGYEIDKDYYDAGMKRVRNHVAQTTLFDLNQKIFTNK